MNNELKAIEYELLALLPDPLQNQSWYMHLSSTVRIEELLYRRRTILNKLFMAYLSNEDVVFGELSE